MNTKSLKVGDRLLVVSRHGFHGTRHAPAIVKKITTTGILTVTVEAYPPHGTIDHEKIFNANGSQRGERYHGDWIAEFDQAVLDAELRRAFVRKKRTMLENWSLWRETLDEETILQIAEIVEKALTKK